jgi:subtilisin family serine protease
MRNMDPAIWELAEGDGEEEVEAVIRLESGTLPPPGVRLVARFGDVATCRIRRNDLVSTREAEAVASLKAPRLLGPEPSVYEAAEQSESVRHDERRPSDLRRTGRGSVIGVVDWGCDFAHPDFRTSTGETRLLALWDQRGGPSGQSPQPYDYGRLHSPEAINRALESDNPYEALGYHPAEGDPDGSGSHGTHVMSIAAGNGLGGGPSGMAPDADLVFVHLAPSRTGKERNLGDSVTLLEALDFIANIAQKRPWVVNLSVGRHGGPHDGSTLVEQGFDNLIVGGPGRCIVQSCGNYYAQHTHASGLLRPGGSHTIRWTVDAADPTPNEFEIWYSGKDTFSLEIAPPDSGPAIRLDLGGSVPLISNGVEVGRVYHRKQDPNNGSNHINGFLESNGPKGTWNLRMLGEDVLDGRFHAWVERDGGCPECQSRFSRDDSDSATTTGTICNGFRTIAVGAYDAHSPEREIGPFSSSGPTLDGRQKPDCLAPGVRILAARSSASDPDRNPSLYTRKSGTSMAAPYVTGSVACMYQAAGRPLTVQEIRSALMRSADPAPQGAARVRVGSGPINPLAAVNAAAQMGGAVTGPRTQADSDNSELPAPTKPFAIPALVTGQPEEPELIVLHPAPVHVSGGDGGSSTAHGGAEAWIVL